MINKCSLKYFNQFCTEEVISLPFDLPDIQQVVSTIADFEIVSLKVINTMKGISYEGQYLTGKKLAVEFKIRQKILYASEKDTQSVHILENELFQSAYIVIPCLIEGTDPSLLVRHKILRCKIDVDDIFVSKTDNRKIFRSLCLIINAELSPVCEIGYSMQYDCTKNTVCIMHKDGTHAVKLTSDDNHKYRLPVWSPLGQEIAYVSNFKSDRRINIYSLKTCSNKLLKGASALKTIGSYCWSADGSKLIISGCVENSKKEIFTICANDSRFKQLTMGNGIFDSHMPKASPSGYMIAFLRCFNGLSDLWVMDHDGMDCTRLTACGSVKCFDWSPDGNKICYITWSDCKPYQICLYDIICKKNEELDTNLNFSNKRKIQFSPDGKYIAFIGTHYDSENIYCYNIENNYLESLTGNKDNTKIYDFVWSADSDKICYSANELLYCNIYTVNIEDKAKRQLTNTTAAKIELSYRPQIG